MIARLNLDVLPKTLPKFIKFCSLFVSNNFLHVNFFMSKIYYLAKLKYILHKIKESFEIEKTIKIN